MITFFAVLAFLLALAYYLLRHSARRTHVEWALGPCTRCGMVADVCDEQGPPRCCDGCLADYAHPGWFR